LSERDAILIVYPDQLKAKGEPPLQTLLDFCVTRLHGLISGIHILPFFRSSSDDGFSVMDYRSVDPSLGDWSITERFGRSFRLMFDAVINHASAKGSWFASLLRNEEPYRNYFLTVQDNADLAYVVRPRTSPLITDFKTSAGLRHMWTTFGPDQVDLDYHNPEVLMEMLDILLGYAEHGAQFIRLDAVAYLWKERGTSCIHLPQAHAIIRLLRSVLNEVAPHVQLVTETNVAHADNVSYFGDGFNEAQLVYNFALPPLILQAFAREDVTVLSEWAAGLEFPSDRCTFINFLASHDGIGLNGARGPLSEPDIDALVHQCVKHGGLVSYADGPHGTQRAYELNISYFDALSDPAASEPLLVQVQRFMAAQAIMLGLRGIPAIYFHSLVGSRNWPDGPKLLGYNRAINRQKLGGPELESELLDPAPLRSMVYARYRELLTARAGSPAFHPSGRQQILEAGDGVFAVRRTSPAGDQAVLCLANVTSRPQPVNLANLRGTLEPYGTRWVDVRSGF
jgi:sucrose phosphorylase